MEVDYLKEKRKIFFSILIAIISASLIFAIKKEYYTMAKIESYDNDFATVKIAKTSYIINENEENKPQNDNVNIQENNEANIKNGGNNSINSNLKNNKINFIHKFEKLKIKDTAVLKECSYNRRNSNVLTYSWYSCSKAADTSDNEIDLYSGR